MTESKPMEAKITEVVARFVACPGCGDEEAHEMYEGIADRWGPWYCDACGTGVSGVAAQDGSGRIFLTPARDKGSMPAFLLVRLGRSEPEAYAVIIWKMYRERGDTEGWQYLVDEHNCPTNILPVHELIVDGDPDPHGYLTYVDAVPIPEGFDLEDTNTDWGEIFEALREGYEAPPEPTVDAGSTRH